MEMTRWRNLRRPRHYWWKFGNFQVRVLLQQAWVAVLLSCCGEDKEETDMVNLNFVFIKPVLITAGIASEPCNGRYALVVKNGN